jgi:ubiquinone/menaquinone biosynthesis C-methylase UbiE
MINTVGKKPTKKEMKLVNQQIKPIFAKIYAHPDRMTEVVRRGYDAKLTKLWKSVVADEYFLEEIKLFLRFTKVKLNYKITSLASGLAVYELFLAKEYVPKGLVSCIEISNEMNKEAKILAKKINQKNIKILTASATKVPIKNDSQDIILARRTGLSNDKKWGEVLNEAYRIIKKTKESSLIITVDKIFNKSPKDVKADLKKANFEFISIKDFRRSKDALLISMIVAKPIKNKMR